MRNSHTYHCWRCLFRIINMRKSAITLRDRKLETTSMIKKQHVVDEEGKMNNVVPVYILQYIHMVSGTETHSLKVGNPV